MEKPCTHLQRRLLTAALTLLIVAVGAEAQSNTRAGAPAAGSPAAPASVSSGYFIGPTFDQKSDSIRAFSPAAAVTLPHGDIVFVGPTWGAGPLTWAEFDQAGVAVCLTPSGKIAWTTRLPYPKKYQVFRVQRVMLDHDGNILTLVFTARVADSAYDSPQLGGPKATTLIVSKLSPKGRLLWSKNVSGFTWTEGLPYADLAVGPDNRISVFFHAWSTAADRVVHDDLWLLGANGRIQAELSSEEPRSQVDRILEAPDRGAGGSTILVSDDTASTAGGNTLTVTEVGTTGAIVRETSYRIVDRNGEPGRVDLERVVADPTGFFVLGTLGPNRRSLILRMNRNGRILSGETFAKASLSAGTAVRPDGELFAGWYRGDSNTPMSVLLFHVRDNLKVDEQALVQTAAPNDLLVGSIDAVERTTDGVTLATYTRQFGGAVLSLKTRLERPSPQSPPTPIRVTVESPPNATGPAFSFRRSSSLIVWQPQTTNSPLDLHVDRHLPWRAGSPVLEWMQTHCIGCGAHIYDMTLNDSYVRLREAPNLKSHVITLLMKGTNLKFINGSSLKMKIGKMDAPWYKVKTPDGRIGWVYGYFVDVTEGGE